MANWMAEAPAGEACQVVSLYSRFDLFQLAGIVGSSMAQRMLAANLRAGDDASSQVHMFVSGQAVVESSVSSKSNNNSK